MGGASRAAGTSNGSPGLQNLAVSSFNGSISAARNANFRNGASHTFTQTGGSSSTSSWMVVGIVAGGNGTFNLNGGSVANATNLARYGAENALDLGAGRSAYFTQGSLAVAIVPEPGTALLGSIGLLAMLRRRRAAC